jgi:hypothetical protein
VCCKRANANERQAKQNWVLVLLVSKCCYPLPTCFLTDQGVLNDSKTALFEGAHHQLAGYATCCKCSPGVRRGRRGRALELQAPGAPGPWCTGPQGLEVIFFWAPGVSSFSRDWLSC